jgi:hypothetical protein
MDHVSLYSTISLGSTNSQTHGVPVSEGQKSTRRCNPVTVLFLVRVHHGGRTLAREAGGTADQPALARHGIWISEKEIATTVLSYSRLIIGKNRDERFAFVLSRRTMPTSETID